MKKKDPTSHRIIEKRRRDRMNNCLADLSKLIPAHYMRKGRGRIEKTEIIEMAIKHLKDLIETTNAQRQFQIQLNTQSQSSASDNGNINNAHNTIINSNINNHNNNNKNSNTITTIDNNIECYNTTERIHLTTNCSSSMAYSKSANSGASNPPDATMVIDDLQQQFRTHHNQTSDYMSHHNNSTSDKLNRSSPSSSSSGSESSISSSISNRSSCGSMGYCACDAKASNEGSSESVRYSSNEGKYSPYHTTGWYKKAWLVRSFLRSPNR